MTTPEPKLVYDDFNHLACDAIAYLIMTEVDSEEIDQEFIDTIKALMRTIDPTESYHAAHIRDLVREETEFTW